MVMKRHKRIAASATTYILLIIALVWTIFPVYWMISNNGITEIATDTALAKLF